MNLGDTSLSFWLGLIYFVWNLNLLLYWHEEYSYRKGYEYYRNWFFKKSKNVNWLGFSIFVISGLGGLIFSIIAEVLTEILYVVLKYLGLSLYWLFEFLFLNKDCSHIVCEDLKKNTKGDNTK